MVYVCLTERIMSRSRRSLLPDIVPNTSSHNANTLTKGILDVNLSQPRGDINADLYLALFSELVSYCRDRVESVVALQHKLSQLGYRIGRRVLDLVIARDKISRRETRLLNMLNFVALTLWTFLYGKQADSLKKVRDSDSECSSNQSIIHISTDQSETQLKTLHPLS